MRDSRTIPMMTSQDFSWLKALVGRHIGLEWTDRKIDLAYNRLYRRLLDLGLADFKAYRHFVSHSSGSCELEKLIDLVTTNHTHFFREKPQLDYLGKEVMLQWKHSDSIRSRKKIRIWSAGCSYGQEPYTLAIMVLEALGPGWDVRILASDINRHAIEKAKAAFYPQECLKYIPEELAEKYFVKCKNKHAYLIQPRDHVRSLTHFRIINFLDTNFPIKTNFDLILCRNVVIYFDESTRRELMQRFCRYLYPEGYLCTGLSESIDKLISLKRCRFNVYQKG